MSKHIRSLILPNTIRSFCSITENSIIQNNDQFKKALSIPLQLQNAEIELSIKKKEEFTISLPLRNVLQPPNSHKEIDAISPYMRPTFNIAAYADRSKTLQQFLKLGVEIAEWDNYKDISTYVLKMDFENHIKPFIFLIHGFGVAVDDLGKWFTKNPFILKESLENIQIRANYLESKKFTSEQISRIVNAAPKWLNISTSDIDSELGRWQKQFSLKSSEVRFLAARDPKLILYTLQNKFNLQRNFAVVEQKLGFSPKEQKKLLLNLPRVYRMNNQSLARRFLVVHNKMGLSHETIAQYPRILSVREHKIEERHAFLKFLGRDQYNWDKANYIHPDQFVLGNDVDFCLNIAKCDDINVFNNFLKTL